MFDFVPLRSVCVALLLTCLAVGVSPGCDKSSPSDSSESSSSPDAEESADERDRSESATEESTGSSPNSVEIGGFRYQLLRTAKAESIQGGISNARTAEGATFLIVYVDVTNIGEESGFVDPDSFRIEDHEQRSYETSSEASFALMELHENTELMSTDIPAGETASLAAAFKLPVTVLDQSFSVVIPDPRTGVDHTGKTRIEVEPDDVEPLVGGEE